MNTTTPPSSSAAQSEETRPHPALTEHYDDLENKQSFLRKAFDDAAPYYEGIAKWGWFGSGHSYRKDALQRAGLKPGMRVIDVASGTGPTARAVIDIVGSDDLVTCIEPSAGMLAESKKLIASVHHQAMADDMPVDDNAFDFLTMGFALRHVEDLGSAFEEFYRVLKPGGSVVILDITLPKNRVGCWLMKIYFKHILPTLTRVFTRNEAASYLMSYYWDTMDQMVPRETVLETLRKAGFTEVDEIEVLAVFTEYRGVK
ncbi:MAG: class I SAM-dependent methyltransferase [Verrucomicrobia bacterium]|nr:class I SAM-dependent methyltransferase [Verrucomicrobiota bacterium]